MDYHIGQSHWVDLTKRDDVRVNTMLSKSHRRAAVSDFSISRMLIIMGVILKNRITIVFKKLAIIFFLFLKNYTGLAATGNSEICITLTVSTGGSVLGPLPFFISMNDLPAFTKNTTFLYADDTTISYIGSNID